MKHILSLLMIFVFSIQSLSSAQQLPGDSIYQLSSTWLDQDNKERELKEFQGSPTLLSMVYLSCAYACPTLISQIQRLELKLDSKTKENLHMVLLSFDPKRDTPTAMKAYLEKRKLDPKHWTLLSPKKESSARETAAALNFNYQKDDKGEFTHSYMILALDKDGVIKSRVDSAAQSQEALIDALKLLK